MFSTDDHLFPPLETRDSNRLTSTASGVTSSLNGSSGSLSDSQKKKPPPKRRPVPSYESLVELKSIDNLEPLSPNFMTRDEVPERSRKNLTISWRDKDGDVEGSCVGRVSSQVSLS